MTAFSQRMLDDMRIRNDSPNTRKSYICYVRRFAKHFNCSPDRLTPEQVRSYLVHLVNDGVGEGVLTNTVCSLRFLYHITLKRDWSITSRDVPFIKKAKRLPVVLSLEEAQKLLVSLSNLKHRTILATLYDCGLRVSELLALTSNALGSADVQETDRTDLREGRQGSRNRETGHSAYAQALLRHPSPGSWDRHPNPSKTPGAFRSEYHGKVSARCRELSRCQEDAVRASRPGRRSKRLNGDGPLHPGDGRHRPLSNRLLWRPPASLQRMRTRGHLLQLLPKSSLPQVPSRGEGRMAGAT